MSAISVAAGPQKEYEEQPLSYRFRKAWRAVFFLGLIPFFSSGLIAESSGIPEDVVRFFSGVIVLIPLSTFIEVVTEDLIERLGQLVGGLLHAFFSNIAYFVITATALLSAAAIHPENIAEAAQKAEAIAQREEIITVVQSSIAGTIVIDLLFILGVAIFVGGMKNGRMAFSKEYSNQYSEMITVAIIALALPSLAKAFKISVGFTGVGTGFDISDADATSLSNVTAVILILAYVGYLSWTVFRFRDMPAKVENPDEADAETSGDRYGVLAPAAAADEAARQRIEYSQEAAPTLKRNDGGTVAPDAAISSSAVVSLVNARIQQQVAGKESAAVQQKRDRNRGIALWELAILVTGAAGVVYISESMAHVFENQGLTTQLHLNPFFVGFILLPVASNLVELSAATSTAFHNRMETCLAVTAGSAIQVALLVAPALILVSHIIGLGSFNLIFGLFILAIFGLIAYLFHLITIDGETSWLEGLQFTSFFAVIVGIALLAR